MSTANNSPIPVEFLERMQHLLGEEYPAFATALKQVPVSALRVNTLKLGMDEFQKLSPFPFGERVPWCPSAFILQNSEFSFGRHPYHTAGLYYLQEPSAMAPAELLDPQPGESILDLAAAPGGKTTAIAAKMKGHGLLVANEIKDKRLGHLAANLERWGAGNVIITNETPERLADHFGPFFDRVLVDAPCSGEGMFRKDMDARRDWSVGMVEGCAIRQGNILRIAAKLVRPGGWLLYSTCTFAPEEDEQRITALLTEFQEYSIATLPEFPGFEHGRSDWLESGTKSKKPSGIERAVRLFPHLIRGEGHFICLMKRGGNSRSEMEPDRFDRPNRLQSRLWHEFKLEILSAQLETDRLRVRGERLYFVPELSPDLGNLRTPHPGVWFGTFKKDRFEPAHPLALFLRPGQAKKVLDLPTLEQNGRSSPQIQAYLRGETLASTGPSGWTLVTVDGWPLGWGKCVNGVLKNHYPKGWQNRSLRDS